MQAYKFKASVKSDHCLSIQLPDDAPVGEAEVIVIIGDSSGYIPAFASVEEFNRWLDSHPSRSATADEIENQIKDNV